MPLRIDIAAMSNAGPSAARTVLLALKTMPAMMITTIPMGTGFTRAP
ncbi:MAG TPA: hypothetical protein VGI79_10865 [Caulobacteraceae bacterium]|jgi:hypothetical protein